MNTILIGFGDLAPKYVEVMNALNCKINGVIGRNYEKTVNRAKEFDINAFQTIKDIELQNVDFFTILVSPENNFNVIKDLIPLKKPIIVEKPIAFSSQKMLELIEFNKQFDTKIMVAMNRRFYSIFEKGIKFLKDSNKTINSMFIEAPERFSDINHPKFSEVVRENWMFSNSIHCIDLIRYFGGNVSELKVNSIPKKFVYHAVGKCENSIDFTYVSKWKTSGNWSVTLYADDIKILYDPLEKGTIFENKNEHKIEPSEVDIKFKPGLFNQIKFFIENIISNKGITWPSENLDEHVKTIKLVEEIYCKK